jgi:hypothetical protein
VVNGVALILLARRVGIRSVTVAAVLGFLFIVGAGFNGASFLFYDPARHDYPSGGIRRVKPWGSETPIRGAQASETPTVRLAGPAARTMSGARADVLPGATGPMPVAPAADLGTVSSETALAKEYAGSVAEELRWTGTEFETRSPRSTDC